MADEAKVRVRLDTTQAKAELTSLTHEAARTAGRVGTWVRGRVSRGLGMVGLGTAVGTGIAAVRGATEGGIGDVFSEALSPIGAQLERALLGDLSLDARASKAAREETISAFGAIAGAQNRIPPEARSYFAAIKGLRMQEETGRRLFESNTDFFGPGIGDVLGRIMTGIGELLSKAVDELANRLNPFK